MPSQSNPRRSTRRFVEVGVDHGGRTFTELELSMPIRWRLGEDEASALVHAHCRLDLNLEDMEGAIADLERAERPVWARQLKTRLKWLRDLEAKINRELGNEDAR